MHALVMEYIEGPAIDDKEKILADGYDMVEIDVMEVKDGFDGSHEGE